MELGYRQLLAVLAVAALFVIGNALTASSNPSETNTQSFRSLPRVAEHEALKKIIDEQGAGTGWVFLKKEFITPDGLLPANEDPHSLAHQVGVAFYKQLGPDGLQECDDSFSTGCYHGFLEGLITEKGLAGAKVVADVCARMHDSEGCVHGTGHAVAEFETVHVDKMLSDCNFLFSDKAFDCWEGGFMNANYNRTISAETISSVWDFCRSVESRYRAACAGSMPLWLNDHQMNTETIVTVCTSAENSAMTKRCFATLGAVVARTWKEPEKIIRECAKLGADQENNCLIIGAGLSRTNQYMDWKKTNALLCSHVTGADRGRCG